MCQEVFVFGWDDGVIGIMGSDGVVDALVGDGEPEVGGGAEEHGRQPRGGGRARLQGCQHGGRLQVGNYFVAFLQDHAHVLFVVKKCVTFLQNNKKLGMRLHIRWSTWVGTARLAEDL